MTVLSSHGRGKALAKAAAALAIAGTAAAARAPAWAVLGETQATIHADVQTIAPGAAYSVSTSTLPTGTVVNEYAAAGKVFAVSWRGAMPPDLSQLLGAYYTQYQSGLAARPSGTHNHHVQINSGGLVLEAGGHMRDLRGIAYVPALMPQGVSAGELK